MSLGISPPISLFEQALGPEHHMGAYPLHGLALLYGEQGYYEQAEALFRRALQIRKRRLGQHHPETAQILYDLERLYKLQGKMGGASSLAESSLQIRAQSLGNTHPKTVASHTLLARIEETRGSTQDRGCYCRKKSDLSEWRKKRGSTLSDSKVVLPILLTNSCKVRKSAYSQTSFLLFRSS